MSEEDVNFTFTLTVDDAVSQLRRVQTIAFQTLGLFRRMGLPENVEAAVAQVQRLISIINQLRLAIVALQVARMAAGDVTAWIGAGVAVTSVGYTVYDTAENALRGG